MELYVRPEFFTQIINLYPIKDTPEYDEHNKNMYTEIRKYTDSNIVSKFKELRYIPLSGGTIDYEDDRWDFSEYSLVKYGHDALVFKACTNLFKDDLKDYILLNILNGNIKASTLYSELIQLRPFLNYLAKKGLNSITEIDDTDVEEYLDTLNIAPRTFTKHQTTIKRFLQYYDAEHNTELLTPGILELCKRMEFKKLKSIIIANRRKAIPDEYFNKLLSKLITVMHDENASENDRGFAAMLVIDSQTGIRASELSLLEADSIEEIDIDGEKARMIKYKITKTAKGNTGYIDEITYINDVSYEAYKVAMEVFAENRKTRGVNYLCCPKLATLPLLPDVYIGFLKKLCVTNHKELDSTSLKLKKDLYGKITKSTFITSLGKNKPDKFPELNEFTDDQEFYYPLVHQFRNTVVTGLLKRGIQLEFIRRYMGHLTQEMTSAYAKSYDTKMQENLSISENALSTIIKGDAKLLGPNASRLTESIDKWIESNELNVATNLNEIIQGLEKLIPIRAKRGGYCMKGSKITNACSVDVQTDEFMCAVGICPNICHFYFNADESYVDYKAAMDAYEYNRDNGFSKQAKKELSKANFVLMNRLAPEMIELDKEINKLGVREVLRRHPSLGDVMENIEEIKEVIDGYIEEKLS